MTLPHPTRRPWTTRAAVPAALATLALLAGAAVRLVLWWAFGRTAEVPPGDLPRLLLTGLVADGCAFAWLLLPLSLWRLALPDRAWNGRWHRWLLHAGVAATVFAVVWLAAVEYFFFEEFDARLNLVAVDYLMYPTEVAGDVWAEYPVLWVTLVAGLAGIAGSRALRSEVRSDTTAPSTWRQRLPLAAAHLALLAVIFTSLPADFAARGTNRVADELGKNGAASFVQALRTSEIDYHAYYATRPTADNLRRLESFLAAGSAPGVRFTRLAEGRLDRQYPGRPVGAGALGQLNVVVICSEAFGAEFSKLFAGNAADLTPQLDRLAQQGLWFSHAYASGTRTVRGLEAVSASFPPIPSVSILRRPGNGDIATWGKVMRSAGYHTGFLYGGYGYFDNMNAYFADNGFEVLDRTAIERVRFENIWGVSDEDLFDRTLQYLDARHATGQPSFTLVMTTSNHKPFTFRAGVPGVPEKGGGRAAGVRYADFAMGYFLDEAKRHAWFRDTLFVIVADHGARVYGRQEIPLKTYEIPLVLYSPAHLAPRRVDTLTGQVDIAPTVLGLLGLPYTAPFFGQDVLGNPDAPRRLLFSHNHDVAIWDGTHIVVYGLQGAVSTYTYDRATNAYAPAPAQPALEDLGIAYYQTAYELFRRHAYE